MIGLNLGTYMGTVSEIQDKLSDRIYPNRVPQTKERNFPRCIITVIGGNPDYSLAGEIGDLQKIVQVDVDDTNLKRAIEIAEVIREEISFFDGEWDGTVIKSCTVQTERDTQFPPNAAGDDWVFRRSVDYRVTYER